MLELQNSYQVHTDVRVPAGTFKTCTVGLLYVGTYWKMSQSGKPTVSHDVFISNNFDFSSLIFWEQQKKNEK